MAKDTTTSEANTRAHKRKEGCTDYDPFFGVTGAVCSDISWQNEPFYGAYAYGHDADHIVAAIETVKRARPWNTCKRTDAPIGMITQDHIEAMLNDSHERNNDNAAIGAN